MVEESAPYLGFGLGLRTEHIAAFLNEQQAVDWLEIVTENYLVEGGSLLYHLDKIRECYPIVMHGVSMSIGSCDPIDWDYLKEVKKLANRLQPPWISDHLCWTGVENINTHELLPLPYSEEALYHVVDRIKQVQDFLGRRILIENLSSYISYQSSTMSEWEFINEIIARADCYLLLDVNNVYVSSVNHAFNPLQYIRSITSSRIHQIHLAGHTNKGDYILDTHDEEITDPVWDLYAKTIRHHGLISTMIERDGNIPPLATLITELNQARVISNKVFEAVAL